MLSDPFTLAMACLAVVMLGLSKGGITGLAPLGTPILALAIQPVQAAAILLPIIVAMDVVSVWAYRKTWNRWIVAWILPGAFVGVGIGYFFSASMPLAVIKGVLGTITFIFALYRLWAERGGRIVAASTSPGWVGSLFGVIIGFTSHVSHSGGPPFQFWVMPRKLPHLEFVGTMAVTIGSINILKVSAYYALGQFTPANLTVSAMLVPLAIVTTMLAIWITRRMDPSRFYTLIYVLMLVLGAKLMWDGFV